MYYLCIIMHKNCFSFSTVAKTGVREQCILFFYSSDKLVMWHKNLDVIWSAQTKSVFMLLGEWDS